jgi:hypothetical protein
VTRGRASEGASGTQPSSARRPGLGRSIRATARVAARVPLRRHAAGFSGRCSGGGSRRVGAVTAACTGVGVGAMDARVAVTVDYAPAAGWMPTVSALRALVHDHDVRGVPVVVEAPAGVGERRVPPQIGLVFADVIEGVRREDVAAAPRSRATVKRSGYVSATMTSVTSSATPARSSSIIVRPVRRNRAAVSTSAACRTSGVTFALASLTSATSNDPVPAIALFLGAHAHTGRSALGCHTHADGRRGICHVASQGDVGGSALFRVIEHLVRQLPATKPGLPSSVGRCELAGRHRKDGVRACTMREQHAEAAPAARQPGA